MPAGIRPTTELARKAAFDLLGPTIESARVLDAAAGSGAYGLEGLSRGAAHATFVESDTRVYSVLRRNVASLADAASVRIECMTTARFAAVALAGTGRFEVVFHDPPFADPSGEDLAALLSLLAPGGVLVHERGDGTVPAPEGWAGAVDVRRYGRTHLVLFRRP